MYEGATQTIDLYHEAIHDGWMFCLPGKISALAAAASHAIAFKTGDKPVHFKPMRVGSSANVTETRISEASTLTGTRRKAPAFRHGDIRRKLAVDFSVS